MEDALFALFGAFIEWILTDPKNLLWFGAAASVISLLVKLWLKEPQPDDPTWKRLVWRAVKALDAAAVNSTPVATMEKAQANRRPPPPQVPPAAPLLHLLAFSLAVGALSACTKPLEAHGTTIAAVAPAVKAMHAAIASELEADRQDIQQRYADPLERADQLEKLLESYRPVLIAYNALSGALHEYYDAVQRAAAEGRKRLEPDLIRTVAWAWDELKRAADLLHVPLPDPGTVLGNLVGGAR